MSTSPLLPWEVIERVIDQSWGRAKTLRSLSLTCRQLLPRSRCYVRFGRVMLTSHDHVFAFVDVLQANPYLKPLVHAIVISPKAFGPSLLYLLPNITSVECIPFDAGLLAPHPSSLACFRPLGSRIQSLRLSHVSFLTPLAFAQVLLAFPGLAHLVCEHVAIGTDSGNRTPLAVTIRRLSKQFQLKTLITEYSLDPGALLFHPYLALCTVECLRLTIPGERRRAPIRADLRLLCRSSWSQLQSLALKLGSFNTGFDIALTLLENFPECPSLRKVTLEWEVYYLRDLITDLRHYGVESRTQRYGRLEHTLLKLSNPGITCTVGQWWRLCETSIPFWTHELGRHFPTLYHHGALTMEDERAIAGGGHDDTISLVVFSPDRKWVASGSEDSTIILWNAYNGTIAQRWVAHGYSSVRSLSFSPDGQYLSSCGGNCKAMIWDHCQGARTGVALYEGCLSTDNPELCVWSPDGNTIAILTSGGIAHLCDVHTLQQQAYRSLQGEGHSMAFSPNGRWLACTSTSGECSILSVASGMLHALPLAYPFDGITGQLYLKEARMVLDFDPGSTRLAYGSRAAHASRVMVVDVEKREVVFSLGRDTIGSFPLSPIATRLSFSPDGKLLLVAPMLLGVAASVFDAYTCVELFQIDWSESTQATAWFSACGRYIVMASENGAMGLWRTSDGSCVGMAAETGKSAQWIDFSSDSRTVTQWGLVIQHTRIVDIFPEETQEP